MERDQSLDFFRGVAALNIIAIHTAFWSGGSYVPKWFQMITLLLDVPFFFFLAGWSFGYCSSIRKSIHNLLETWRKWIGYITVLAVVCLIFNLNGIIDIVDYIKNIFFFVSFEQFSAIRGSIWFMPVYIKVTLVISIMVKVIFHYCNSDEISIKSLKLLLLLLFIGYTYTVFGGSVFFISAEFFFYAIFYMIGYLTRNIKLNKFKALVLIVLAIILEIFSANVLAIDWKDLQLAKFPPTFIYMMASFIFVIVAIAVRPMLKKNRCHFIQHIGRNALYYYFAQGIGTSLLVIIVNLLGNILWPLKWGICFAINVGITIVIAESYRLLYEKIIVRFIKLFEKQSFFE